MHVSGVSKCNQTEIWYRNYCKIIVRNTDVKLINKNGNTEVNRIFFRVPYYVSLKTKKESNRNL